MAEHTLVAFSRTSAAAVEDLLACTPVADQTHRIEGEYLYVGEYDQIGAIYAVGAQVDNAQIDSPTLRDVCLMDISPVDPNAEPSADPPGLVFFDSPAKLTRNEGLRVLTDNNAAAAEDSHVFLALTNGAIQPVKGIIHRVKCTNTDTLTAGAWTNGELTFSQTLPVGRYQIVGAYAASAGMVAFRFAPIGGRHRPGGIGGDTYDGRGLPGQRSGGWGVWLEFDSITPPSVDFYSISADTSQEVWIDLIKIR